LNIDATFLPVADLLVNTVFPTQITYRQHRSGTYDPLKGTVTKDDTDYKINAGILSRSRVEGGGTSEAYELMLWVEHKTLPILPKTGDEVTYDNTTWKVTEVAPTYSSKGLIASKLKVRSA
jgi:hypothetical protein